MTLKPEVRRVWDGNLQVYDACKARRMAIPDDAAGRPADLVRRQFAAARSNQLWVSGFTYVAAWTGMAFVAFVIDVFAHRIVGWRVASSIWANLVLDALGQALCSRNSKESLVHHSD